MKTDVLVFVHFGTESVSFGASFRNDRILQIGDPPDVKDLVFVTIAVS